MVSIPHLEAPEGSLGADAVREQLHPGLLMICYLAQFAFLDWPCTLECLLFPSLRELHKSAEKGVNGAESIAKGNTTAKCKYSDRFLDEHGALQTQDEALPAKL